MHKRTVTIKRVLRKHGYGAFNIFNIYILGTIDGYYSHNQKSRTWITEEGKINNSIHILTSERVA